MGLNITLSYKKLCIKILLVFFFGFPFFIYMVLRLFLTLEIMSHTNQLVCTNSQVLTNVVYRLLESLYRLSPRDDTREEYKTFGPAIGMVLTFVLNEDWEKTKSTKKPFKEIVKTSNDTFEYHANLSVQGCSAGQELFYLLSFFTCLLIIVQTLIVIVYFLIVNFWKRVMCRGSGESNN